MKRILINKQGADHLFSGTNNQDYMVSQEKLKIVLDGCGSTKYAEVGTKLFAQMMQKEKITTEEEFKLAVDHIFAKLTKIEENDLFFLHNLCFTILACLELEEYFLVFACGDGYILLKKEENLEFRRLEDGEYPQYYIYNYVQDKEGLVEYKEGVTFDVYAFSKKEYQNVGVATDGLRFFENLPKGEQNKLKTYLQEGKKAQIAMLINRNQEMFHDDITICF